MERYGDPENHRHDQGELGDDHQAPIGLVQLIHPSLGAHHDVLDAHPEPTGEIDPRLDRECHPRLQEEVVSFDHVRMLMNLEADAMPSPVDEEPAITRARNDASSPAIDLLTRDTGGHDRAANAVGLLHPMMDLHLFTTHLPYREGPGHIGEIPTYPAPEVTNHKIAILEDPETWLMMG